MPFSAKVVFALAVLLGVARAGEVSFDRASTDAPVADAVLRVTVATPARSCAVVTDGPGDAGPVMRSDGQGLPGNQRALDLLAAGADVAPDGLAVTVRVADPSAAAPAGYDQLLWTVSWQRSGEGRWYAQATRTGEGFHYTVGEHAGAGAFPLAAMIGGTPVAGAADPSGIITVFVPRDAIGDTQDGSRLAGFAATASAMTGNGVYTLIDETASGSYLVGRGCGA